MSRIFIRNVSVLDPREAQGLVADRTVVLAGGRIEAVDGADGVPPALPGDVVIEGRDRLLAPGLVNAHTHSQSSTLPGFGDRLSHPAFMWLTQAHTSRRTRDEIRLAVRLAAYGMLATGTTAAIDHFPGQRFTADDLDAVLSAWDETGLRATLAVRFFDRSFADILPPALPQDLRERLETVELLKPQPLEGLEALITGAIERWHDPGGRLSVFPAPSNPDRCSDEALGLCADIAARHDLGIHTHLLETERQVAVAQAQYGMSSVARLDRLGVLSDRWSCAHSIWLSEADMALMGARGATAVLNPESNARLGTGLCPIPALRRHGVKLALGTDGAGSNDNLAMHEAMRAVATAHRAGGTARAGWISAREAFEIATGGGARAIRKPGLGAIAPGAPADLVLYRLDGPWWMPVNDAVAQLVFAETGACVETVIVDGEILYAGGRPTRFDPGELRREIADMVRSLRLRNADLFDAATQVAGLS